jgi:hypothetical protein
MRIKIKLKVIVDILLFMAGLVSIVTGLTLLILPSGPGARAGLASASSSLFDITTRGGLRLLHDWSSIIIIALIFFHLMLNWRIILCYVKNVFRPADQKL